MIGNKIADKITSVSKKRNNDDDDDDDDNNNNKNEDVKITAHKKRYVSPEERQQLLMN